LAWLISGFAVLRFCVFSFLVVRACTSAGLGYVLYLEETILVDLLEAEIIVDVRSHIHRQWMRRTHLSRVVIAVHHLFTFSVSSFFTSLLSRAFNNTSNDPSTSSSFFAPTTASILANHAPTCKSAKEMKPERSSRGRRTLRFLRTKARLTYAVFD